MLPTLSGEFGIVSDPELTFASNGNARLKLRVIAKDRKRDSNGNWTDGDPWFGDVVVWGKTAENLMESVAKGDSVVIASAKAQMWTSEKDGQKRTGYEYVADMIGVSVRWKPTGGVSVKDAVANAAESLGAAPF